MELRLDDLAFELRYASGDVVRIYVGGRVEGPLPPNTVVINKLWLLLDCLQARAECGYLDRDNPSPEMLAAASEVIMSFYMGDGVYDLREPCLAALYKAMREADDKAGPPQRAAQLAV